MKIPYGKQFINDEDISEVINTLKRDFLTTGPKIKEFEEKFAEYVGSKYAVSVSNGTAALHLACLAAGLRKGDEIITSPMTFAASANCALYCNAKPIFSDITEQGLLDEDKIEEKITKETKIIIPVHYSGLPCNMEKIKAIADKHNQIVIEDACHALGGEYKGSRIGDCRYSDMAIFSFHPVKHITTGEGGMITTNSKELYEKLKMLRTHGITKDAQELLNHDEGEWYYEMQELGYNYRITEIQCALGISQLKKVEGFINRRREIARKYNEAFKDSEEIQIIKENKNQLNSYHLYILKLKDGQTRLKLYNYLKEKGILCQVHYIPVYWHPYYQKLGYSKGLCPEAESFYPKILSIPIYPSLSDEEQEYVIEKIKEFFGRVKSRGIILQARMGSSRLSNKIMKIIGGKPELEQVYDRCKMADVGEVIIATSDKKENDIIEQFCKEKGIKYFRGAEEDVLDRLYQTALKYGLDIIIRITGDCPLISPEIINKAIKEFKKDEMDYLSNAVSRNYPRGLDVEIFSFKALEIAHELAKEKSEREHVTSFIYGHPDKFRLGYLTTEGGLEHPEIRLCLDTQEDLDLLNIIYDSLKVTKETPICEVISFLLEHPDLIKMNNQSEADQLNKNKTEGVNQQIMKVIELRRAGGEDCLDLYQWRNSPEVRKLSHNTCEITYEEHVKWFNSSLDNPSRVIYIALSGGQKIGQIRFDEEMDKTAIISITVKPEERGKGYGTEIIRKGTSRYLLDKGNRRIIAEIKAENAASIRAFEKAGYTMLKNEEGTLKYIFENGKI